MTALTPEDRARLRARALWEASEDRRIASLMRNRRNAAVMEERAATVLALLDALDAAEAELGTLRTDLAGFLGTEICGKCGHWSDDHADGIMGARSGDVWLCHTDDHSCYAPDPR